MPAAIPWQRARLDEFGVTESEASAKVWLVSKGGAIHYGGARAVSELLRRQPDASLRFLGWLGTVPPWSWAAEGAYRLVARYRYLLPGGTPACRTPPAR